MEITERREGGVIVLSPVGRIDNDTSPDFQRGMRDCLAAAGTALVIDFAAVEFISSAGLGALLSAADLAKSSGGHVGVACLRPLVQEIFAISRFTHVLPIFGTVAEAVAGLR
jgi:anti-anti-sigma factor